MSDPLTEGRHQAHAHLRPQARDDLRGAREHGTDDHRGAGRGGDRGRRLRPALRGAPDPAAASDERTGAVRDGRAGPSPRGASISASAVDSVRPRWTGQCGRSRSRAWSSPPASRAAASPCIACQALCRPGKRDAAVTFPVMLQVLERRALGP
jgi:hypothetical protein